MHDCNGKMRFYCHLLVGKWIDTIRMKNNTKIQFCKFLEISIYADLVVRVPTHAKYIDLTRYEAWWGGLKTRAHLIEIESYRYQHISFHSISIFDGYIYTRSSILYALHWMDASLVWAVCVSEIPENALLGHVCERSWFQAFYFSTLNFYWILIILRLCQRGKLR